MSLPKLDLDLDAIDLVRLAFLGAAGGVSEFFRMTCHA